MAERPELEFTVGDEDVQALRSVRAGRLRVPLLEGILNGLAFVAVMFVALFAFLSRRLHRLHVYLAVLLACWALGRVYLAFFFMRRSPETKRWFEQLRNSPVFTKGNVRVRRDDDGGLTVVTPTTTRAFAPHDLEDAIFDGTHFYVRTAAGEVIIIPRRVFASDDEFAEFVSAVETRVNIEMREEEQLARSQKFH